MNVMTDLNEVMIQLESGSRPKGGIRKDDNEIPSLGAEHLNDFGGFNFEKMKFVSNEFANSMTSGIIQKEDILIVKDGATTGKVSFVNEEFPYEVASINEHLFRIQLNHAVCCPKYIFWYLWSPFGNRQVLSDFRGSTIGGIAKSFAGKVKLKLPPLSEQKRIANILDKADSLRQKRKESIALLDELLKSVFIDMFGDPVRNEKGWEVRKAKDLFEIQLGKMLSAKNFTGKNLKPYLRNINVQWDAIDTTDIKTMDFDDREFKRYKLRCGDILVTEGGDVGRTAIYEGEVENCCYQNALHRLRKKVEIDSYYFLYFMMFAAERGMILKRTSTVTIAHFTAEKFKEFNVSYPDLELQEKFGNRVASAKKIKKAMNLSEKELDIQFNALLQRAFGGEGV